MGQFAGELAKELSQGDVFPPGWDNDRTDAIGPVVIISHDCEVDKSPHVLVATVVGAQETPASLIGDIKKGRVFHALHLDGLELGWANLRTTRPVSRDLLLERLESRVASMTEDGRDADQAAARSTG